MSNNPGYFQHHPPHGTPYIPHGASIKKETSNAAGPLSKSELKKTLQKLIQVSHDMDSTGRSMGLIKNPVQQSGMKEKMDRLSKEQALLLKKIVDTSQNEMLKKEFIRLSTIIGEFQQQIRNCKTSAELEQIQKKMDTTVDTWINIFKDISMDAIKCSE